MLFSQPNRVAPRTAFTLVELLVAMTVLLLLLAMLFGVFNATVRDWQRSEARVDAYREARAALALIARDLSLTLTPFPADPAAVDKGPLAPVLVLARHPDDQPFPPAEDLNEQIHAVTLHAIPSVRNADPSALCLVSYACRWDDTSRAYNLTRRFTNSKDTFVRLKKFRDQHPAGSTPSAPMLFSDLFSPVPSPPPSPADRDDIAGYIWDLQFRLSSDLNAAAPAPPPTASASSGGAVFGTQPPYPDQLPPYVEVRFKAMSAGSGPRLRGVATRQTWTDPASDLYRRVILPNSQQFVQRVPMQNVSPSK